MSANRSLIFILVFLLAHAASAQTYLTRFVNFRDSANAGYLYGTELGAVLLHGYLDNQLKSYSFDINTEDVKWKPVPEANLIPAWDPKLDYYSGDKVVHKGKYYECIWDVTQTEPSNQTEHWYEMLGEPVSTIYSFPTDADTTNKTALLRSLSQYQEEEFPGDPWDPQFEYYMMDVAEFNGQFYECIVDHSNKQPDKETEFWQPHRQRIAFYSPRDLYGVRILHARTGSDSSILVPQLLSVYVMRESIDVFRPILNFRFQDVMNYLSRQPELPVIVRSRLGYTGTPQLLLADFNGYDVVSFLRKNLKEGKLKPAKKGILSPADYESFLKADGLEQNLTVTQDLLSNDIVVTLIRNSADGATFTPMVKVAWKSLEPLLAGAAPTPRTWGFMEGLQSDIYLAYTEKLTFDTLKAMTYQPVAIPSPVESYFVDQRFASTTGNPNHAQAINSLWSQLKTAYESGMLMVQPHEERPFLCDQPFPATTLGSNGRLTIEAGFQLEERDSVTIGPRFAKLVPSGIIGEYRRVLTQSKGQSFKIQRLGVRLFIPEIESSIEYFFKWADVKKIVQGDDVKNLVNALEKGKVMFDTQIFVGGVMGVR